MGYKCGSCPGVEFADKRGIVVHMQLVHGSEFLVGDEEMCNVSKSIKGNPKMRELRQLFNGEVE